MNRKVEVDLKKNFANAVVGIDPPPDPADVDNAIKRMKTIYHKVAGLPCNQAAIATAHLIHKFHGELGIILLTLQILLAKIYRNRYLFLQVQQFFRCTDVIC